MNDLYVDGTNGTPAVLFNVKKGILMLSGKSLPEDAIKFYEPIEKALDEYIANYSNNLLIITCEFEYINTSSSKALYNILMKAGKSLKNNISIIWGYEEDDDDMLEQGHDFSSALGIEFEYRIFAA